MRGDEEQRVAIITGGSQGIGAGLVAGYRGQGWGVVANALTIKPPADRDVLSISATIAERANSKTPAVLTALTKGGLAAATRSLAIEYGSRGIRVNAVSPGVIQTRMHPPESYADLGDRLPPLGRVGQISDIVDGIMFLEASAYITGEILHIDGGQIAGH